MLLVVVVVLAAGAAAVRMCNYQIEEFPPCELQTPAPSAQCPVSSSGGGGGGGSVSMLPIIDILNYNGGDGGGGSGVNAHCFPPLTKYSAIKHKF